MQEIPLNNLGCGETMSVVIINRTMQVSGVVAGKRPIFQFLAMFSGILTTTCSGMHYGWASPSLPQLLANDSYIPMSDSEGSWVAVALPIGALSGSISAALVVNKFGRKPVILFSSIPFFTSWMILAFARSISELIVGRLLAGIPDGLTLCTMLMYLGEISNHSFRGFFGSAVSVAFIFGILLINILGSYFTIITAALISSALPVLLFLTFIWMPESPYYLIMKGKMEKARHSLQVLKRMDDVEEELNRITQAVKEQTTNTGRYMDLFTVKSNRRALYIMIVTRGAQECSGVLAITFYAQIIFEQIGNTISPKLSTMIFFTIQLVFSGFSAAIVDKTGRRPLLIISLIGCSLSLLMTGLYFCIQNTTSIDVTQYSLVPIAGLIMFIVMFAIGLQTIPMLLLGEIFPTNVKAFALSLSDVYFLTTAVIVAKFFQFTKDTYGMHIPFFVFSGCCTVGLVFVILYVHETKGKTLEQIQLELGELTMRH